MPPEEAYNTYTSKISRAVLYQVFFYKKKNENTCHNYKLKNYFKQVGISNILVCAKLGND